MTRADRPVTRATYSKLQGREIVVTIHSTWLAFRLKGTRQTLQLDALAAYQCAAKMLANQKRAEKQAAKSGSRNGR